MILGSILGLAMSNSTGQHVATCKRAPKSGFNVDTLDCPVPREILLSVCPRFAASLKCNIYVFPDFLSINQSEYPILE